MLQARQGRCSKHQYTSGSIPKKMGKDSRCRLWNALRWVYCGIGPSGLVGRQGVKDSLTAQLLVYGQQQLCACSLHAPASGCNSKQIPLVSIFQQRKDSHSHTEPEALGSNAITHC
jgi:hypothetical protein